MNLAQPLDSRASGILLHISSLPGPHGIGDFGPSAHHFVGWLESAGQHLWQLLPMTPIGPGHSPYQSVSAFAGSPLMVALEPLVARGWLAAPTLPDGGFDAQRVDFERVGPWRLAQLRAAAAGFAAHADAADRASFIGWCEAQAHWLDDYASFMALEAAHEGRPWWQWGAALAARQPAAMAEARIAHAADIGFWRFVQWCFDVQWTALKQHANARGIAIMGDLPIFIAHHSADCWGRPDLYFLDHDFQPTVVAGVPPDFFSATGQRWGNPLYRWDRMAAEGHAWWIARVKRALAQADMFRIDHFRGFAGYWEIPAECPDAVGGRWVPGPGKPLFDAIERAVGALPIVAEDLGVITDDVKALRDDLGFPGMRVLQFGFGDDASNAFLPHNYTPRTVAYSGTHDNDTTLGWWATATPRECEYAPLYLGVDIDAASTAPPLQLPWAMVRALSLSVAQLVVFPLQDVLALGNEARMNLPGSMGGRNWTWRFDWAAVGTVASEQLRRLAVATARAAPKPVD